MSLVTLKNNHVSVSLLDSEVKFIFDPYLRSAPFRAVRPENLYATIAYADGSIPETLLRPDDTYTATIKGAQIWWDSYLGIKDLVVLLDSPDLEKRHTEILHGTGIGSVYEAYVPHITLAYDIPNATSRYRWWINNILEVFDTKLKGTVLRLGSERLKDSAGTLPPRGAEKLLVKPVL